MRLITLLITGFVLLHALVHLMGFVAYWPLGSIDGLPYKTALIGGRWEIGRLGMRVYSTLWVAAAFTLLLGVAGQRLSTPWWFGVMSGAVLLSLVITALDWENAFWGMLISGLMLLFLLLVLGLRVQPRPFAPFVGQAQPSQTLALSADLPSPVARFYQTIAGDEIPVIESAVITARGTTRIGGVVLPARLRFTHAAGQGYRHYIETTFYRQPILMVDERYLDGEAVLELPFGTTQNEPKVDMAANLGLWGESIWLPSIYLTDPRVRWEAIDADTAYLIVPFEVGEDRFTIFFDPETGLITRMEAQRYKGTESAEKVGWLLDVITWQEFEGLLLPATATATWADEDSPWLVMHLDEVVYNVDIEQYIRAKGE